MKRKAVASTSRRRGRPRKGLRRVDAALDTMRSYGFADCLTVSTVDNLLKVYGDEGWPFIEENSYKVLLDAVLEKVEESENQGKSNAVEDNKRHENNMMILAENNAEISAAGASSSAFISTCHDTEAIAAVSRTNEALQGDSQAGRMTGTASSNGNAFFPASEGEGSKWKDMEQDRHCAKKQINDETVLPIVRVEETEELGNIGILTPLPLIDLPRRNRRPCYGWLSSDDEEEDDDPMQIALGSFLPDRTKIGKRWWDVKPKDV